MGKNSRHDDDETEDLRLEREAAQRFIGDSDVREIAFEDIDVLKQIDDYLDSQGGHIESFVELQETTRAHTDTIARSVVLFGPRGWAVPRLIPISYYAKALTVFDETQDIQVAENELLDQIRESNAIERAIYGLPFVGVRHPELGRVSEQRNRLVQKALQHHKNRAYEASIPILLSQIDGLFRDYGVNSLDFFVSSPNKFIENFLDPHSAIGWKSMILPLRKVFAKTSSTSGSNGSVSRNRILHGRELSYDTETNSTKCFVLLASVIEWAMIRAKTKEAEHAQAEEERHAGKGLLDEEGRQLDRREWDEISDVLHSIERANHWEMTHNGRYHPSLAHIVKAPEFKKAVDSSRIEYRLDPLSNESWYWIQAPSGFYLGLAQRIGKPSMWAWAYDYPPTNGPSDCTDWKHFTEDELPLDLR